MSVEDINEITEQYYDWLLANDYHEKTVQFTVFEEWFVLLTSRITKSKLQQSDFDVERVEQTVFGNISKNLHIKNELFEDADKNCKIQ